MSEMQVAFGRVHRKSRIVTDRTQIAAKLFLIRKSNYDKLKKQQHHIEPEFRNQRDTERLEWSRNPHYSPYPQVGVYNRKVLANETD